MHQELPRNHNLARRAKVPETNHIGTESFKCSDEDFKIPPPKKKKLTKFKRIEIFDRDECNFKNPDKNPSTKKLY